jgi:hypothetical protein
MTTRLERLSEFSQVAPPASEAVQVLCEDHAGTYLVPYQCRYIEGKWVTDQGAAMTAKVVGWRQARL